MLGYEILIAMSLRVQHCVCNKQFVCLLAQVVCETGKLWSASFGRLLLACLQVALVGSMTKFVGLLLTDMRQRGRGKLNDARRRKERQANKQSSASKYFV